MLLFAGIPSEPPLALAIAAAASSQIPFAVFNQRRSKYTDLTIDARGTEPCGQIWLDEKAWELSDFTGIYARTVDPSTLPENRPRRVVGPAPYDVAKSAFLNEAFNDWLEVSPSRVANRPGAMSSNSSKPYQCQLILRHGFRIPPTLVTNDPEQVIAFRARHRRIVYKSTSAVRSIVREWLPDQPSNLARLRLLPTQFQAFVAGKNVRVHVVGTEVFATEISCEVVDYRYAGREGVETSMTPIVLPPSIAQKCVSMTESFGLTFAGIDLKRTNDDEWFCFEVNTSPGFSYFQEQTGQPIAQALVSHLSAR